MQLIKASEVVNSGIYRAAPTTNRFDTTLLAPHIAAAEERFIVPLLGDELYLDMISAQNSLDSNYNAAVGTVVLKFPNNPNYEALWVRYLLRQNSWVVFFESLKFINYQVGSSGIFVSKNEISDNAGEVGIRALQDAMLERINDLSPKVISYLCKNKAQFPLFDEAVCSCAQSQNLGTSKILFY